MPNLVSDIKKTIRVHNEKKGVWSYLTSVEYMLASHLYTDQLMDDAHHASEYIKSKDTILDFGTGSGVFAVHLRSLNKSNKIVAIDAIEDKSEKHPNFIDSRDQQKAVWKKLGKKYNISFSHYDGRNIPYPDGTFDVITAYAVLEHVPPKDLTFVVKELGRVIKKGGRLFVFRCPRTLSFAEHLAKLVGFGHHDLLYSDKEMKTIVSKSKLKFVKKWRSDMVIEFPGRITNRLYPILKILDKVLIRTPLNIFAHDVNLIFEKDK